MRFYTKTHKQYCGIDLHAKKMFVCILDADGAVLLHRNIASSPEAFLRTVGGQPKGSKLHIPQIQFQYQHLSFVEL